MIACSTTAPAVRAAKPLLLLIGTMYLVFAAALSAPAATMQAPAVKRVLILHSFGRDFAPYNAVSSQFRTELARQSAAPIEFLEASLETARFTEGRLEGPFVEYLRALFGARPPHLLVSFGAPAMNFLQRHRNKLFPGVPLLASAVDKRRLSGAGTRANAIAVGVDPNLPQLIENILQVLAGTSRVEVEAYGGRLWAKNNPGRGATFYFTLPISSASDDRIAAASGA